MGHVEHVFKMPHVHVYCSGEARCLTGGLGLHILSVLGACCVCLCWVRAACVRARARSSGQTVSRLSSGLTNDVVYDQYFLDYNFYTYSCLQL